MNSTACAENSHCAAPDLVANSRRLAATGAILPACCPRCLPTYDVTNWLVYAVGDMGDWWLQRTDVHDVAQKLGLEVTPVIGEGTLLDAVAWAKRGIRSTWGDFQAEGIVAQPKTELHARSGHRLITKIKCRDFAA